MNQKYNFKIGDKINKLELVEKFYKKEKNRDKPYIYWKCLCECGNMIERRQTYLGGGRAYSCGCSNRGQLGLGEKHYAWKGYENLSMQYFNSCKKNAINRNYEFSITIEQAWKLFLEQGQKCALTGISIILSQNGQGRKNKYKSIIEQTASLDRIDSARGYILDNIQWIHKRLQNMKWNYHNDYFVELCSTVVNYDGRLKENRIKIHPPDKYMKKTTGVGNLTGFYVCTIRHNAKARKLDFDLDAKYLWELFESQNGYCVLSGLPIDLYPYYRMVVSGELDQTASIDRIDSNIGYIKGNVHWVHKDINKIKSKLSNDDFYYWVRAVHAHKFKAPH